MIFNVTEVSGQQFAVVATPPQTFNVSSLPAPVFSVTETTPVIFNVSEVPTAAFIVQVSQAPVFNVTSTTGIQFGVTVSPPPQFNVVVDPNNPEFNIVLSVGIPGVGVPPGGTTGQVLAKTSNTDYDTEWVSGGGGGAYTGQSPTTVTVGGLAAGSAILSETYTQIFQTMLVPYVAPSFSSFSISGEPTSVEVGTTISGTQSFIFGFNQSGNVNANTLSIIDVTDSVVLGSNLPLTSPQSLSIGTIFSNSPTSHSWKGTAVNSQSTLFSSSYFTMNWLWRIYYGLNTNQTLAAADIQGLNNNNLASSVNGNYSFGAGSYKYFCWPDSFGSPSAGNGFKDTSNNLPMAMATSADNIAYNNVQNGWYYAIVSVTNVNAVTTNYRVYRTQNVLSSAYVIAVS